MRALSIAFAASLLLGVVSLPHAAKAAPNGSYRDTCRNLRVDGPILYAECQAGWGWRSSSVDYKTCGGDIANQGGYLVCRGSRYYGRPDYDDQENYSRRDRGDQYGGEQYGGYGRGYGEGNNYGRGGYGGLILFAGQGFSGPAMAVNRDLWNLDRTSFNDRTQSVRINGGVWLLCQNANFGGRCITLSHSESNLWRYGLAGQISSVRRIR